MRTIQRNSALLCNCSSSCCSHHRDLVRTQSNSPSLRVNSLNAACDCPRNLPLTTPVRMWTFAWPCCCCHEDDDDDLMAANYLHRLSNKATSLVRNHIIIIFFYLFSSSCFLCSCARKATHTRVEKLWWRSFTFLTSSSSELLKLLSTAEREREQRAARFPVI